MPDSAPASGPARAVSQFPRWAPFAGLMLLWALGSAGLLPMVGRFRGQPFEWDVLWDDTLRGLLSLFAGLACLGRSRHPREPYPRPWRAWGAALLWHAAATAYLVVVLDLVHLSGPWGSLRHVGYTLSLLCLGQGVLAWPVAHRLPTQRAQTALDGLMVGGSALFMAWGLLLRDLVQRNPELTTPYVLTLAYPILAIAAGTAWFFQETRAVMGYFRGPLNLLRLGLALQVVCQGLYSSLSIHGAYRSDLGTRLDILFGAGTLCFGLAALWPRSKAGPVRMPQAPPFLVSRLVYIPVLAAMGYGALRVTRGQPADALLAWTWCALGFLLCAREHLALRDLSNLSGSLEARVEARTAELRRSQAELLRAQRVQAVAAMAAGISHDLKNLFAAIQSWAALMRMEQGPAAHEGVGVIEQTAIRGHRMVQELLAVGRQVPMQPRALDAASFLSDLAPALRGTLGPGVALRLEVPEDPVVVVMDPEVLEAVLLNLVSNAVDAMPGGGTLTLAVRQDPAEAFGLLEVRDTGTGIPAEQLERIFDPFFTTKPPGKGSGLGLSSVQGILAQAGGDIRVESEVGKGSCFILALPQRPLSEAGAQRAG